MIMPYVKQLKRFLLDGSSSSQIMDLWTDNQSQKSNKKFANGLIGNGNGSTDVTKKRQRHKSLGDLDGVKPLSGVSMGFQQQGKLLSTVPNGSPMIASNGKRKVKPNSKRQLFGGDSVLSGSNDLAASGHYFDDNANTTPTNYGKQSTFRTISSRQSTQQRPKNALHKKALVPIDVYFSSDPNIDQWNHFTFDRSKFICKF